MFTYLYAVYLLRKLMDINPTLYLFNIDKN